MKKLNRKGFTLIELLAVITIMGILMLVAIPAVSRTIENTRRDTFASTAKSYIKAVRDEIAADNLYVDDGANQIPISAAPAGDYYYGFDSAANSGTDLMEQGGKSSWGNANVQGYVAVRKTVDERNNTKYEYAIFMVDAGKRGIGALTYEQSIKRSTVATKDAPDGKTAPSAIEAQDKFGEVVLSSGTEGNCKALSLG